MRSVIRQLGVDTRYLLISFPLSVIGFSLLLTGVSLAAGTIVLAGAGLLVMAVTLTVARGFAEVERRQLPEVLRMQLPQPRYRRALPNASWLRKAVNPLTNGQPWLDLLHGLIIFPFAIAGFVVAVTWWSVAITGVLYPAYGWILFRFIPEDENNDLPELLGLGSSHGVRVVFYFLLGLLFLVTLPLVIRLFALIQAGIGRALLTGMAGLQERIEDLTEGRAAAVSAEANALRRLERDIHDGPQQRLVHLAMELARARRQMSVDPKAAESTLDSAISSTRETLDELRALSRGIAPPVLTDRGLVSALAALAGRCTVPVELDLQTTQRYPAAVENTVYFVVAETLTNIAKHSQAASCAVSLQHTEGRLILLVSDDGVGGAHLAKGHGLAGLADRLRAVDGDLTVHSEPGGPTVVGAEIPCEPLAPRAAAPAASPAPTTP